MGISTRDGALNDAEHLYYCQRLERERIHLLLIDDARRGLADIAAGRTVAADDAIAEFQQRRIAAVALTTEYPARSNP